MKYMHLKWSFLFMAQLSLLQAQESIVSQLGITKHSLAQLQQAASTYKKPLRRIAKASAAFLLMRGLYNVMWLHVDDFNPDGYKNFFGVAHRTCFPRYQGSEISSPPYLTALALSLYLIEPYPYKKVGEWLQKRFMLSDRALTITKNLAKISGAFLLLKGHYHLANDQLTTINRYYQDRYDDESRNVFEYTFRALKEIVLPHTHTDRIATPPYIPAIGISTYLLGTGSYGIYKEVKDLIQESKKQGTL